MKLTVQDGCTYYLAKTFHDTQGTKSQAIRTPYWVHWNLLNESISQKSFRWPHLDQDFEAVVAQCEACKIIAAIPTQAAHHPWQYASTLWERVCTDHGEWNKTDFLAMVDAFTKWPEVKIVSSTTTQKTITVLSEISATHGFLRVLVLDNGSQFISTEYEDFLQCNEIIHYKLPPHHPSSNGLAENIVKNVKNHLKKDLPDSKVNISHSTSTFLSTHQNIPHTVINKSPSNMVLSAQTPNLTKCLS